MRFRITAKRTLLAVLALGFWLLFMIVGDGLAVLVTLIGSAVTIVSVPVLWLSGNRRSAGTLLAGSRNVSGVYLVVSTGIALIQPLVEHPLSVGQEVCADSGCFAVEKVDKETAGSETVYYTLYWRLSSNDKELTKHFPGNSTPPPPRCSDSSSRRLLAESVALVLAVREPSEERELAGLPDLPARRLAEEARAPCWRRSSWGRSTSACATVSSRRRAAIRWRSWSSPRGPFADAAPGRVRAGRTAR